MPHLKAAIIETTFRINRQFNDSRRLAEVVGEAHSLAEMCDRAELTDVVVGTVSRIQPELQEIIFTAMQTSAKADRGVYITWRAGLDQQVTISVPRTPGLPTCIEFVSGFAEDGIVRKAAEPDK